MARIVHFSLISLGLCVATAHAQNRYLNEVFTNDQIIVTPDVVYGTNINFMLSDFTSPNVPSELMQLHQWAGAGQPIAAAYYDPADESTAVKVQDVRMDIYQPDQTADTETDRPVVVYIHTGNALPPPLNGSPNGTRKDSSAVEICKRMARRGYVAVSMSYRHGWNPIAPTLQERRGTLLNAIYRAIHDVKQCVRTLKQDADMYNIDANKVILFGEGTGGYIALATATLDEPQELFIEKFLPDPFNPNVSYVDTAQVGNLEGFNGMLNLYYPNGLDSDIHFSVNLGGALADTSWLAPGDAPMVAFHTVNDPFAPFGDGIVIVPTTGEQVVDVNGSNSFMQLVNAYGNNSSFATLPSGDMYTDIARSRYGTAITSSAGTVNINSNVEGLYPVITSDWPSMGIAPLHESGPWQWWDPNSAVAQTVVNPGPPPITAHQASLASNPNMSPEKGRAMIDTIMGYTNPRIVCALQLGPCSLVSIEETDAIAAGVEVFPNPAHDLVSITSTAAPILRYELFDMHGRLVDARNVNSNRTVIERNGAGAGVYYVQLHFAKGTLTRKLIMD